MLTMDAASPPPAPISAATPLKFRGRIFRPEEGYAPRSLLELGIRAGIGEILNKQLWWEKWRRDEGAIRNKWLAEIERDLVNQTFDWSTSNWSVYGLDEAVLARYCKFPAQASDDEKREFIDSVCSTVEYFLIWNEELWETYGEDDDDDDEEEDSDESDDEAEAGEEGSDEGEDEPVSHEEGINEGEDEAEAHEEDSAGEVVVDDADLAELIELTKRKQIEVREEFDKGNAGMESYGQITWYFELVLLNKELRAQPLEEWTEIHSREFELGSPVAVEQATAFLLAVRDGSVTKESFRAYCPEADHREFIVDELWVHVDRIMAELDRIRLCITNTLEKVIENNKLDAEIVTEFISPGPVQETWMSDVMISDELEKKFKAEVAVLENVPEEDKDWHPDSDNQVLDLVHPSLHCCVFGKTIEAPVAVGASSNKIESLVERMQRMMFVGTKVVENEHRGEAKHQWIPTPFSIGPHEDVEIVSYINNLHPVQHSEMYQSIGLIFKQFIPMFNRVLSYLLNPDGPQPFMTIPNMYERETYQVPHHPEIPDILRLQPPGTPFTLKGRTIQVIVKIAEIHLTPEKPAYAGGAWHVEGSDAEQIVATGIYYFGCENITDSRLSFRVIVSEPEYAQDDTVGMAAMYGLQRDERLVQTLGSVKAAEGRCVVFPNTLQHRVEPFELADPTKPGVRKILAYFLVDPSKSIPSTLSIPPQQSDWLRESQDAILGQLKGLPDVVLEQNVKELLGTGMTLDEAKQHRLELMEERKPKADDEEEYELFFSLCEH